MGKYCRFLATAAFITTSAFAQTITITNATLGEIKWDGPAVGYYQVEWAYQPAGPWFSSWVTADRPATTNNSAKVPAFYRVVWTTSTRNGVIRSEELATVQQETATYSGHLKQDDISTGSVNVVVGSILLSDNGSGALTGTSGASGTINYRTGFWFFTLGSAVVPSGTPIEATYAADADAASTTINVTGEIIGSIDNSYATYNGSVDHSPLVPGSITIQAGAYIWTDNGSGNLSGTAGVTGTINYDTGSWSIDLQGQILVGGTLITAAYQYYDTP